MTRLMSVLLLMTIPIGARFISTADGWAYGGSPGFGIPECFRSSHTANKQSLKLVGTMVILITAGGATASEQVDVMVRLQEKNGFSQFFRLHFVSQMSGTSNAEKACFVFNPNHTNDPGVRTAVNAFLTQVRTAFQLALTSEFQFVGPFDDVSGTFDTRQAVYNDESEIANKIMAGTGSPGHAGSLGDFTLYAFY
jgi:hypothetical protein